MEKIDINILPEKLESKEISINDAVNLIWSEIYINPFRYGLADFDEDERSDFLLEFREKLPSLFRRFDKSLGFFSSYLRGCIFYKKISWKKNRTNRNAGYFTTDKFLLDKIRDSSSIEENELYEETSEISEYEIKNNEIHISDNNQESKSKVEIFTILALTLKACNDVDDKLISKISNFTGMKEDALHKLVQEMKSVASKNKKSMEKIIKRRNNAFYFRRKYGLEMQNSLPSSESYEELQKRYNSQTKNWIKNNEILQNQYAKGPSNVEIAKKLGLNPRTVGFYLFCAKKKLSKTQNEEISDDENSEEQNLEKH